MFKLAIELFVGNPYCPRAKRREEGAILLSTQNTKRMIKKILDLTAKYLINVLQLISSSLTEDIYDNRMKSFVYEKIANSKTRLAIIRMFYKLTMRQTFFFLFSRFVLFVDSWKIDCAWLESGVLRCISLSILVAEMHFRGAIPWLFALCKYVYDLAG